MEKKTSKAGIIFTVCCLSVMFLLMCSIGIRLFTSKILMQKLGMDNGLTDLVMFDIVEIPKEVNKEMLAKIDWEKRYPFEGAAETDSEVTLNLFEKMKQIRTSFTSDDGFEGKIMSYATDMLVGYKTYVELAGKYEKLIGWNFASFNDYNGVYQLPDGYLAAFVARRDATEAARSVIGFSEYCAENGMDFLYVQAPCKISKDDFGVADVVDFSNQNADDFMSELKKADVTAMDLREIMQNSGRFYRDFFYRTDVHWLAETGLWATSEIVGKINSEYGYTLDISRLQADRFEKKVYENWFLGSFGKKVTLSVTSPEDFTMLYPEYETRLHYTVPSMLIDTTGGFSVTYDMSQVSEIDYYNKKPYMAYNNGCNPVVMIENQLSENDTKILFIGDSFGCSVVPFLALEAETVHSLDLRTFNGSVKAYMEEYQPDIVVVLYYVSQIDVVDWDTHKCIFDFR